MWSAWHPPQRERLDDDDDDDDDHNTTTTNRPMKFQLYLASQSVPEWRNQYIDYGELKRLLAGTRRRPSSYEHAAQEEAGPSVPPTVPPIVLVGEIPTGGVEMAVLGPGGGAAAAAAAAGAEVGAEAGGALPLPVLSERVLPQDDMAVVRAAEPAFFDRLDGEVAKANRFYQERLQDAQRRWEELAEQLEILREYGRVHGEDQHHHHRRHHRRRFVPNYFRLSSPTTAAGTAEGTEATEVARMSRKQLREGMLEFYRLLNLLKNFQILNFTAVGKIMKKFDKVTGWMVRESVVSEVSNLPIFSLREVDAILKQVEKAFADHFYGGQHKAAMNDLRMPPVVSQYWITFRDGIYVGLMLPAFIAAVVYLGIHRDLLGEPEFHAVMRLYGGIAVLLLFCILGTINLLIWIRFRVNYAFIFEFDMRHHVTVRQFFELVAVFGVLYAYSFLLYTARPFEDRFSPHWQPVILVGVLLTIFLMPLPIFYWHARKWLIVSLLRVFFAPLRRVEFRDFFLGDQLISLVYVIITIPLFICDYATLFRMALSGPCNSVTSWIPVAFGLLPFYWRMAQCLRRYVDSHYRRKRDLVNFLKYLCGALVVIFSGTYRIYRVTALLVLYVVVAALTVVFTSAWDVYMDWGLFRVLKRGQNFLLRENLLYPAYSYYTAMVLDVVLRFAWVLTISDEWRSPRIQLVFFLTAVAEAYRRCQWNIFRVENEHLNNVGQFRVVHEVPLPFSREQVILLSGELEEEEEGAAQRAIATAGDSESETEQAAASESRSPPSHDQIP